MPQLGTDEGVRSTYATHGDELYRFAVSACKPRVSRSAIGIGAGVPMRGGVRVAAGTFRGARDEADVTLTVATSLADARRIWVTDARDDVVLDVRVSAPNDDELSIGSRPSRGLANSEIRAHCQH
ncbi:MAG: hypothetical protein ACT4OX_14900 [Actinomycetota bacterium]